MDNIWFLATLTICVQPKHICANTCFPPSYFGCGLMFFFLLVIRHPAVRKGRADQKACNYMWAGNSFCILPFLLRSANSEQHVFLCQVPVCVQDRICCVWEPRPAGGLPVCLPAWPQHCSPHLHPQPLDTIVHLLRARRVRPQPLYITEE